MTEVDLRRELHAEVVLAPPVGVVLPLAELDLGTGRGVFDRIEEEFGQRVLLS
jgi:hypothetical protein